MSKIVTEGCDRAAAELARMALDGKLDNMGTEIYRGRNTIRTVEQDGTTMAVKYFSRSLKNRLVYAIWSSKARRSYEHANELLNRGIHTPRPVSYGEKRGPMNILLASVYISQFEESETLEDYLNEGEESWIRFAGFMAELHKKGFIHKDLNCTNVRVKREDGEVVFSLIDLNRMDILPQGETVNGDTAYRNLVRFSVYNEGFETFAKEYARLMNLTPEQHARLIAVKKKHEGIK